MGKNPMRLFSPYSTLALLLACGGGQAPAETTPQPEEETPPTATAPEAEVSPLEFVAVQGTQGVNGNAEVEVPAGWTMARAEDATHFRPPDGGIHIAIASQEIVEPFDPEDQVRMVAFCAGIWRRLDPTFRRQPLGVRVVPGTAWDLLAQVHFDAGANGDAAFIAVLAVHGTRAYVSILDGNLDALARRGADANVLIGSLRPEGYEDQDWAALEAQTVDDGKLASLRAAIETLREAEHIPGAAVLVTRANEVLFSEGFGLRATGGQAAVSDRTLFMIGSATKPFVSLLAARLIADGQTTWETPVHDILPSFALADEAATAALQLRHTLCACTGFPRRDLEFIFEYPSAGAGSDQCLNTLRTLAPTTGFGETFQYSNQLVALGGYALGRVSDARRPLDAAFSRALDREVLRPLGMRNTTLSMARARRGDHASPHASNLDGETIQVPFEVERAVESVGPAGALWSNLRDLSKYVQMELRGGVADGDRRFLEEDALMVRRESGVAAGSDVTYGLGLFRYDLNGLIAFGHGGNTLGFTSDVIFFPTLDLAVVTLANAANANGFTESVRALVLEMAIGVELNPLDAAAGRRRFRDQALAAARAGIRTPTSAETASMVGTYRSADLGEITIRVGDDGELVLDAGEWSTPLALSAEEGGGFQWVLREAPLAGLPILQEGNALRIPFPQANYQFDRVVAE
ncbi:MAG: CubicO group peptidase (beta-lactamase class C family) [Polyangiales bacterium]|jgi:CubicO group peptidase (beta-lactamase class C family)